MINKMLFGLTLFNQNCPDEPTKVKPTSGSVGIYIK